METGITEIFNNYAFPTAIVIILMIFIFLVLKSYKQTVDSQRDDVKEMNKQYHEDITKFSEVLSNNTNALNNMNQLVEVFIRKYKDRNDD